MKKFTETNVLHVLIQEHEDGYISAQTFCRMLTELGLLRRFMHEAYNDLISDDEAVSVIESADSFESFPQSKEHLDEIEPPVES